MPLSGVPADVHLKLLQPLATPAVVKPEAIIVGPGDRMGPEVGETATDGDGAFVLVSTAISHGLSPRNVISTATDATDGSITTSRVQEPTTPPTCGDWPLTITSDTQLRCADTVNRPGTIESGASAGAIKPVADMAKRHSG
jgi:hypothetical protein